MTETDDTRSAPEAGRPVHIAARLWAWLVEGLAALGTALIGVLMLIICADIVARNVMGASLPMISELGATTLVMIVYLQLAATIRAGRLPRAEIFIGALRRRRPGTAALLEAAFNLAGSLLVGLIAWSTIRILSKDYASGEFIGVTGIATMTVWPFRLLILVGVTVAAVEFLVRVVAVLRRDAWTPAP